MFCKCFHTYGGKNFFLFAAGIGRATSAFGLAVATVFRGRSVRGADRTLLCEQGWKGSLPLFRRHITQASSWALCSFSWLTMQASRGARDCSVSGAIHIVLMRIGGVPRAFKQRVEKSTHLLTHSSFLQKVLAAKKVMRLRRYVPVVVQTLSPF